MRAGEEGIEIRSSLRILDCIREEIDYLIEINLDGSLNNLYRLEEDIPRELISFIERLRALPVIEERELSEE